MITLMAYIKWCIECSGLGLFRMIIGENTIEETVRDYILCTLVRAKPDYLGLILVDIIVLLGALVVSLIIIPILNDARS